MRLQVNGLAGGHAGRAQRRPAIPRLLAAFALLVAAAPARPDPSNGLPTQFRPSLPVFGGGRFVNFVNGDNQAMTNAAAHVGFSLAVPLLGEHFWGRKGLWATGLSWMALTMVQESLFHAPAKAGPGYPAEVRSDLLTRLVPCAGLLIFDAIRGGGRASVSPGVPTRPEGPGMPWPVIGMDAPRADRESQVAAKLATVGDVGRASSRLVSGGQAPALRAALAGSEPHPVGRCTELLLLEGSPVCSWDAARLVDSRQLAAR